LFHSGFQRLITSKRGSKKHWKHKDLKRDFKSLQKIMQKSAKIKKAQKIEKKHKIAQKFGRIEKHKKIDKNLLKKTKNQRFI
jgi:hypothetical protein